jgi:hypothetical protein
MSLVPRTTRSLRQRLLAGWARLRPGATLFETLLTLVVAGGVLAAGAAALNERSFDIRDKASADHLRILTEGAQRMLRENYARLANPAAVPAARLVFQAGAATQGGIDLAPYLPPGFTAADATSRNAYRQLWRIVTNRTGSGQNVRVDAVVVLSEAADSFPLRQSGTVSRREGAIVGLAGPNAGVVDGGVVRGAFGGWQIIGTDLLPAGPGALGPNDRMAVVLSADRGGVFGEYLHRQAVPGFPELNRMQTNIDMAGNDLLRVNQIGFGDQGTAAPANPADPNNPTNANGQIRFVPGAAGGGSGAGVEWTGPWTPNLPGIEIGATGAVTVDAGQGFRVQTGPGGDVRIDSGRNVRIEAGQNGEGTISLDGQDVIVGDPASDGNRGTGNIRAQALVLRTVNDLMFTAPEGAESRITDPGGTERLVSLHDLIPRVNLRQIDGAFNFQRVPKPSCPWGVPYVVTTLHSFQTASNAQPMPWETWVRAGSGQGAPTGPSAGAGYGNVYYRVAVGPGPDPAGVEEAIAEQRLSVPMRVRAIDSNNPLPQDLALYSDPIAAAQASGDPEGQWVIVVEYLNQFPTTCPGDAGRGAFFQDFNGEAWGPSRVTLRPVRPGETGANRCIYENPNDAGRPFVIVQGFCGAGAGSEREPGAFGASGNVYVPQGLGPGGGQPWSQPAAPTGTRLPAAD